MQTFLPYFDFKMSAKCLDNKRLVKQNLENRQILNTLCGFSSGWSKHPAVLQWKNNILALISYGLAINDEVVKRGFKDSSSPYNKYLEYAKENNLNYKLPDWTNNESITSSHRSRLICKGEIDSLCDAIKKHFKIKKIDDWCKEKFKLTKNALRYEHVALLQQICAENNLSVKQNHYKQFNWTDNPAAEYVWPKGKE